MLSNDPLVGFRQFKNAQGNKAEKWSLVLFALHVTNSHSLQPCFAISRRSNLVIVVALPGVRWCTGIKHIAAPSSLPRAGTCSDVAWPQYPESWSRSDRMFRENLRNSTCPYRGIPNVLYSDLPLDSLPNLTGLSESVSSAHQRSK